MQIQISLGTFLTYKHGKTNQINMDSESQTLFNTDFNGYQHILNCKCDVSFWETGVPHHTNLPFAICVISSPLRKVSLLKEEMEVEARQVEGGSILLDKYLARPTEKEPEKSLHHKSNEGNFTDSEGRVISEIKHQEMENQEASKDKLLTQMDSVIRSAHLRLRYVNAILIEIEADFIRVENNSTVPLQKSDMKDKGQR
jgi:hypothetical protein